MDVSKSIDNSLSTSVSTLSVSIPEKLTDVIVPNNSKPFRNRSYATPSSGASTNSSTARTTESFPLSNSNSAATRTATNSNKPYRNRSYAGSTVTNDAQHTKSNSIL